MIYDSEYTYRPLSIYCSCSSCGNARLRRDMAYIVPEEGFDMNFFPEIGSVCRYCSKELLYEYCEKIGIKNPSKQSLYYFKDFVLSQKYPSKFSELVLLLIRINETKKDYDQD